jgi:hypothetical protein
MKLDREKLRSELKTIIPEIRALKKLQRESHQPNYGYREHYRRLHLKKQTNLLCTLLAHSRGHIHRKGMTLEEQAALMAEKASTYVRPQESAVAA